MTCRRAFEDDLLALVHGEGDAELRAHVERCVDCAAELQVWRELDGLLQAGAAAPTVHPAPEALVAFVDAPASLAPDARLAIERHVSSCRPCADELRALGAFGTVAVAAPEEREHPAPAAGGAHAAMAPPRAEHAGVAAAPRVAAGAAGSHPPTRGLGSVLWHPAFAYALVVLLLVPLLRDQMPKLSEKTRAVDARRDAPLLPAAAGDGRGATGAVAPAAPGGGTVVAQAPLEKRARKEADAARPPSDAAHGGVPPAAGLAERPSVDAPAAKRADDERARVATNTLEKRERQLETLAAARQGAEPAAAGAPGRASDGGPAALADAGRERGARADDADAAAELGAGAAASGVPSAARAPAAAAPPAPEAPAPPASDTRAPAADGAPSGGAPAPAKAAAPLVLDLQPQKPTVFTAEVLGRPVLLRLTPPPDLARGPLSVTVRGRANPRELVRLAINGADAIAVAIPEDWLASGDYVVTLQPVKNGLEPAGAPALLGFTVRAPTAR